MTERPDIILPDHLDKRGHKSLERRCVARNEVRDPEDMIRFVLSPDNIVTPDLRGKLPGRGVWVSATRADLETAIQKGGFKRGFKGNAQMADDLVELVEAGLKRQVLGLLGMAKKSNNIFIGYDQVTGATKQDALGWRIEARDGSADGRSKIRTRSRAVAYEVEMPPPPVLGCFTKDELGQAVGRDQLVHAAIPRGRFAKSFGRAVNRLAGFMDPLPSEWPDLEHELKFRDS